MAGGEGRGRTRSPGGACHPRMVRGFDELDLPRETFDLVLVTRYLQRDLFPGIRDALRPGGIVLYETFTTNQRRLGVGPTSPDHLLEPGELARHFDGFEMLFYEEVLVAAVARIVARKPGS